LPVSQSASAAYLLRKGGKKVLRPTRVLTVVLVSGAVVQMLAGGRQDVDVTGARFVSVAQALEDPVYWISILE